MAKSQLSHSKEIGIHGQGVMAAIRSVAITPESRRYRTQNHSLSAISLVQIGP